MIKISYLIPTNRDFTSFLYKVIESIKEHSSDFTYEILVYSKENPEIDSVVWIEETESKGPIYGFNKMCKLSVGEYIVCLVDDHILINSINPTIELLESMKSDDKPLICSLNPGGPCFNPIKGQILGDRPVEKDIDKYSLIRFPVLHRATLIFLDGFIFNPNLTYHAGDIWLGFYIGYNFGDSFDGPTHIRAHNGQKNSEFEVEDCNIVRELIYNLIENKTTKYSNQI